MKIFVVIKPDYVRKVLKMMGYEPTPRFVTKEELWIECEIGQHNPGFWPIDHPEINLEAYVDHMTFQM